jgi:hypothetical protein
MCYYSCRQMTKKCCTASSDLDIHAGPGDCTEDEGLRPLQVQYQQVYPRVTHGHQQAVQGEALHLQHRRYCI